MNHERWLESMRQTTRLDQLRFLDETASFLQTIQAWFLAYNVRRNSNIDLDVI